MILIQKDCIQNIFMRAMIYILVFEYAASSTLIAFVALINIDTEFKCIKSSH